MLNLRAALVAMAAACPASAFAENCAAERGMLFDGFERNRWVVEDEGFFTDAFGTCKISRMALRADGLKVDVGTLEWTFTGLNAIETKSGVVDLKVKLRDLRMVPTNDDPWIGYMLDQQNRHNLIDGDFSATLNLGTGTLELERLDVDLPGDNAVSLTFTAGGIAPEVLSGNVANLMALSVNRLEVIVTNTGFADGLILGALMGAMSDLPGTPEGQIEATRRDARAIVDGLPDDILINDSKAALGRLIDDAPVPWGTVSVSLTADPALPLVRFPALALASNPFDPGALGFAFSGSEVSVTYTPAAGIE